MSGKTVQLRLDEEALATIDHLCSATSASSSAEVLRDALGVYSSLEAMLRENPGKIIALVDHGARDMQELRFATLQVGRRRK